MTLALEALGLGFGAYAFCWFICYGASKIMQSLSTMSDV